MRGFFRLLTVLSLALVLTFAMPVPRAHAAFDAAAVVAAITALGTKLINYFTSSLGINIPLGSGNVDLGNIDGTKVEDPCKGVVPKSEIEYQEKCMRPYMAVLAARTETSSQQSAAARAALEQKMKEAQNISNWQQEIKRQNVQANLNVVGLDEEWCAIASMKRSDIAQIYISKAAYKRMVDEIAKEGSGSTPTFGRGAGQYDMDTFDMGLTEGLFDCTGNDGANADLPGCSQPGTPYVLADTKFSTLMDSWVLEEQPKTANYMGYADMFVKRNLFNDRAFSAIPPAELKKRTGRAAELMTDRNAYAAKMSVLMSPYLMELAERAPVADIAARDSLEAKLTEAGITDEPALQLIRAGKISKAASEFIIYKIANRDPKGTVKLASNAGANTNAIHVYTAERTGEAVSLLYDIRETLKMTNKLLGLMGGLEMKDDYESLQAKSDNLTAAGSLASGAP